MTRQTIITILTAIGLLFLGMGLGIRFANKSTPVTLLEPEPTLYEITLECQKLSAQTTDKYRMETKDGKEVMITFGYETCIKELKGAVKSKGVNFL